MAREITIEMPFDIPYTKIQKDSFFCWSEAATQNLGPWGVDGRELGVGFVWKTRKGLDNKRLAKLRLFVLRSFFRSGLVDTRCAPYNLEQRIIYIRDGDPGAILRLREGS